MGSIEISQVLIVFFGALSLLAGSIAIFARDLQLSVLGLWGSSTAVGCLFLCYGMEYLAFVQWTISALVALGLIFYWKLVGAVEEPRGKWTIIPAVVVTAGLGVLLFFASRKLKEGQNVASFDAQSLGSFMIDHFSLELEIVGILLLFTIVGSGVMSRLDGLRRSDR